jgi:CRP-like cAMP-binding protein
MGPVQRLRRTVPLDAYVVDVLLRDIVGHDQHPGAFLVFLLLYAASARCRWRPVAMSLRDIAEATGLSKSAVQAAMKRLRSRELVSTTAAHATAKPHHRVLRHWRATRAV